MKTFRNRGALGALLDEYEKALNELYVVLRQVQSDELHTVVDQTTKDEDCRSIQTILSHVLHSGYRYVHYFNRAIGEEQPDHDQKLLTTTAEYILALKALFAHTEAFFNRHPTLNEKSLDSSDLMVRTNWGVEYTMEQLFEHAIVHILRHRRQIERFIQILNVE